MYWHRTVLWLVVCISAGAATAAGAHPLELIFENTAEALLGSSAHLVCDLTPDIPGDHVSTVVWYRDDDETPIYTYDGRTGAGSSTAASWSERAYMRVSPTDARLTLDPVRADDEGTYRCRSDFRRSTSRTSHVNLTVIVPPKEIIVTDDSGSPVKNGVTMQYAEGASASLACVASGGRPLPRVSWWRNGVLLDDTDTVSPERQRTRNVLRIERLSRRDLLTTYVCEASNSQTQPPLQVPVKIDMYLRPLDVRLLGTNTPLSADSVHEISCRTHGSRPPAVVGWFKDGLSLEEAETREFLAADGNSTTSILSLRPVASDSGMTLQCRVHNTRIPHSELRDTWMLHVLYPPEVGLTLGASLNASNIREGADVYFECHITANPWVHRVAWAHDGRRLVNNVTAGIIVSNQTLVLQSVSKSTSGLYTCTGVNTQGSRDSNPIHLDVKYEPVCGKNPQRVFGAAKQEEVRIECRVDANPVASLFRWTFNNTASSSVEVSTFSAEQGGGRSLLTYTPHLDSDYGTLLCWGRNALGSQAIPCVFHVVPAGRPDPPHNCTVSNRTHHSFAMSCTRGFDGGLRQRFSLLVWDGRGDRERLVLNVTSGAVPEFTVTGLEAGQEYRAMGFAYNEKGWSRGSAPVIVTTMPQPNLHEQRRSTAPTATITVTNGAWPYIVLGLVVTLIVIGSLAGLAARRDGRCCARNRPVEGSSEPEDTEVKTRQRPVVEPKMYTTGGVGELPPEEAADPDLILLTTGDPYCQHAYGAYTISTGSGAGLATTCLQPCLATSTLARHSQKRNCATQMPVRPYHMTWGPDIQIHDELPTAVAAAAAAAAPPAELSVESIRRNVQTQTQIQLHQQHAHQMEEVAAPAPAASPQPTAVGHKESSV